LSFPPKKIICSSLSHGAAWSSAQFLFTDLERGCDRARGCGGEPAVREVNAGGVDPPYLTSLGFHPSREIPAAKISNQLIIRFTGFFPKQFCQKFFPGFSRKIFSEFFSKFFLAFTPKYFSGTRNNPPVRDFPKTPHRTFRWIPASTPHLMQPTLNPSSYQPAPFFISTQPAPC